MTGETRPTSELAGLLSMNFEPCSVAAAELARAAHNAFPGSRPYKETEEVEDEISASRELFGNSARREDVIRKKYNIVKDRIVVSDVTGPFSQSCVVFDLHDLERSENLLQFALIQNVDVYEPVSPGTQVGRRFFNRQREVQVEPEPKTFQGGEVWLASVLCGGRVLLPIASFQRRQASDVCSYVQLGSEISNESLFGFQDDESSSRIDIINSLRNLIGDTAGNLEKIQHKYTEEILNFANSERARNAENVMWAVSMDLLPGLLKDLRQNKRKSHGLFILEPNGHQEYVSEVRRLTLSKFDGDTLDPTSNRTLPESGGLYRVSFEAVQPVLEDPSQGIVTLAAVVRGNLAIPYFELYPNTGEIKYVGTHDLPRYHQLGMLLAFKKMFRGTQYDDFEVFYNTNYGRNVNPQNYRIERERQDKFLFDNQGIRRTMDSVFMPSCERQEALIRLLGAAAGKTYSGVVNDIDMVTTSGGVRGDFTVSAVGDSISVEIRACPDALEGEKPIPIKIFDYNPGESTSGQVPKGYDAETYLKLLSGFKK